MKATSALALLALAPAASLAQNPTSTGSTVTFALSWEDVNGTPNGALEPGESVLFRLTASFTNQNGTISFSPGVGVNTSGTIRGLGAGYLDLVSVGLTQGTWDLNQANGHGVTPTWDVTGQQIHVLNGGATLQEIQFGQFPLNAASIVTTNPIVDVFTALWTPASYAPGYREFRIAPSIFSAGAASWVHVKTGTNGIAAVVVPNICNYVVISIPSPASALILAAPLFAPRRRRR